MKKIISHIKRALGCTASKEQNNALHSSSVGEYSEIDFHGFTENLSFDSLERRKKISKHYQQLRNVQELSEFETRASCLILTHLLESEYKNHNTLMREVRYLLYYTFDVLRDDYFLGSQYFRHNMTRIDDYLFSQFGKNPELRQNILRLRLLAFSKRFVDTPRKNILSYYVFLEESGFEIIELLQDYYLLLERSSQKTSAFANLFRKKDGAFKKKYKKPSEKLPQQSELLTLITQQTQQFQTPYADTAIESGLKAKEGTKGNSGP